MFSLIVAVDKEFNIGRNGQIPWSCPEDMNHFRSLTFGNVVIMGRKTYDSIGKPLPNRINVVISHRWLIVPDNVILINNPWDAVKYCAKNHKDKKWFVIGGSQIYNWFLSKGLINDMHITYIKAIYENCDSKFLFDTYNLRFITNKPLSDIADYTHYTVINKEEEQCLNLLKDILINGNKKPDRTGIGTKSLFGRQLRFNLRDNTFPLMTTRKMFLRGIFAELMLFIRGQTNNKILEDQKISIWRGNTSREFLDSRGLQHMPVGDMGASYGFLFRHFGAKYTTCLEDYTGKGVDQLQNVIKTIKTNPNDRRIIISLWDPTNINNCPLPPCLYNYQFYVYNNELYCMMTQRSSDFVVAGGWNIATGALLTNLIASVCGLTPAELIWNLGDVHIYSNLMEQAKTQLERVPRVYPKLFINKKENIEDFEFSDLEIIGYNPHPAIEMTMNV
jgi:dihydrofolate reductase/thymidylate synthase